MDPAAPPVITSLVCHAHVATAVKCFASLRRCHQPAFRLVIHDDGTLTDEDCALLATDQPGTTFVRRVDADGPILAALERYPACRRYRARHPLALKLFDIPLLAERKPLVYADTDIYYLRPFTGFARLWQPGETRFVFTQDIESVYAVRWFHVFGGQRIRFISRLNSGIMVFDPAGVDLDRMEHYLSRVDLEIMPQLIEQTCWAAQAAAQPDACWLLSPEQVNYPLLKPGEPAGLASVPAERVALHFVTFLRDRLAWMDVSETADRAALPPVDLATIPAPLLGVTEYLAGRIGKQVRRWQDRFA